MQRDSAAHIFTVAALVCLVCATAVSSSSVFLRDRQRENRRMARQENILVAAGLWEPGRRLDRAALDQRMQSVEPRMVDLDEGWYTDSADPTAFEARRAARDPATSVRLARDEDAAGIVRRERFSPVYLVARDGRLDQVVLPVRGYGLWSTMWAFLALDAESIARGAEHVTIRGVTFYEHGETPGLGGEVENPRWQQRWEGKRVFDADWRVVVEVTKQADPKSDVEIDALSGATITSSGVGGMLQFWLGPRGFGPYLRRLHEESGGTADGHR